MPSFRTTDAVWAEDPVIEKARLEHVPAIVSMVHAAYSMYIERLGKKPAPMTRDYNALVEEQDLYVLRINGDIVGAMNAYTDGPSLQLGNIVVDPAKQGKGYGRLLMEYAEQMARERSLESVTLYTNVKMYENIRLYGKIGFVETGRKTDEGFERVFFRKDVV